MLTLPGVSGIALVSKVRKNLIPPRHSMCLPHLGLFPLPPRLPPSPSPPPCCPLPIIPFPSPPPHCPTSHIPLPIALLPISPFDALLHVSPSLVPSSTSPPPCCPPPHLPLHVATPSLRLPVSPFPILLHVHPPRLPLPSPLLAFLSLPARKKGHKNPNKIPAPRSRHATAITEFLLIYTSKCRLKPTAPSPYSSSGDFTSILQIAAL